MYTLYVKTTNDILNCLYTEHKSALDGDSGIDIFFSSEQILGGRSISNKIDFNIQCKMEDSNGQPVSYWLLPRSSIGKTGIRQCNSMGLIDAGYRGNLMAYVDNCSGFDYTTKVGDRLFQIASPTLGTVKMVLVDDLGESTERGSRGFGSTGK